MDTSVHDGPTCRDQAREPRSAAGTGRLGVTRDLRWVRRFRRLIASELPALLDLAQDELGRDRFELLAADFVPLLTSCRWHERNARRILASRSVRSGSLWQLGQRHRLVRAPLGRVAIIATWNYPVQLLGVQLVQAITGGNSVVVKPSERAPRIQLALLELARSAGLDQHRLSWTEPTRDAGQRLLDDHRFDHIVFTGSTEVGRSIAASLAESLTPSTLELSGADSAIVLSDADPQLAARSIGYGSRLNAGQTCMAPRRVIVHRDLARDLVANLREHARDHPLPARLTDEQWARCIELARDAASRRVLSQPAPEPHQDDDPQRVLVIDACPPDAPAAVGDHFGPVIAVLHAESDNHALKLHHRFDRHLATSLFTRRVRWARTIAPALGAGVVTINDAIIPTAHPGLGLAGRGPSGWGITRGEPGLLAMTRPVTCTTTMARVRAPTTPPTRGAQGCIERLVELWYSR